MKRNITKLARDILLVKEDEKRVICHVALSVRHVRILVWKDLRDLAMAALTQSPEVLVEENHKLRKRLEMTHVYQYVNGKMIKRTVSRGHYLSGGVIYDGIDCRDETIRQQDRYISELELQLTALRESKPKTRKKKP